MPPSVKFDSVWAKFLVERDAASRETLAKGYYFLVEAEGRRLLSRLPIDAYRQKKEDIVSAGGVGLLMALEAFAVPANAKDGAGRAFEAYARFRIRGQMLDELRQMDFASRDLRKAARELREAEETLQGRLGRKPHETELAEHLGWPLEDLYSQVAEINMLNLLSLDARQESSGDHGEGRGAWEEVLADPNAADPLQQLENREKVVRLTSALGKLSLTDQKVMHLYYVESLTFKEIGKVLSLSESRICQIHHLAIFRLQTLIERGMHDRAQ
jgi:RNA polymerase sigma factor for flagellar operon FliA